MRVCYDIANGNVYVDLMNKGAQAAVFTITPMAYLSDGEHGRLALPPPPAPKGIGS